MLDAFHIPSLAKVDFLLDTFADELNPSGNVETFVAEFFPKGLLIAGRRAQLWQQIDVGAGPTAGAPALRIYYGPTAILTWSIVTTDIAPNSTIFMFSLIGYSKLGVCRASGVLFNPNAAAVVAIQSGSTTAGPGRSIRISFQPGTGSDWTKRINACLLA